MWIRIIIIWVLLFLTLLICIKAGYLHAFDPVQIMPRPEEEEVPYTTIMPQGLTPYETTTLDVNQQ